MLASLPEYADLLLTAGVAVDVPDGKSGRTALFHAAENKQFNIASLLLQAGASVNVANYSGNTAVQVCVAIHLSLWHHRFNLNIFIFTLNFIFIIWNAVHVCYIVIIEKLFLFILIIVKLFSKCVSVIKTFNSIQILYFLFKFFIFIFFLSSKKCCLHYFHDIICILFLLENLLFQAANGRGHTEMVALLIKYGADASHSSREPQTDSYNSGGGKHADSGRNPIVVSHNMLQVCSFIDKYSL